MRKILLLMTMVATLTANAQSWNGNDNGQHHNSNGQHHNSNGRNEGYFHGNFDYNRRDGRWDPHSKEYIRPVDRHEVKMIIDMLKKISFDNQRVEVAKVCVTLRPVTTEDLFDMAKTFQFDNGRAQFLEYAMQYSIDPEKAYILQEAFSFRNNADNFFRSIGYYRNSTWRK